MYQVLFSFDSTGSMYPALNEVRRRLSDTFQDLFTWIPELEIGLAIHGDYNEFRGIDDGLSTDHTALFDFSRNVSDMRSFVNSSAYRTSGFGNGGECYEAMLHDVRQLSWKAGAIKILVMIGDEPAHGWYKPRHYRGHIGIPIFDWRNELALLKEAGIIIYPVQALREYYTRHNQPKGRFDANGWYEAVASNTDGYLLFLDELRNVVPLIQAIGHRQVGIEHLATFEPELRSRFGGGREMDRMFDTLLERQTVRSYRTDRLGLVPCSAGRFQRIRVYDNVPIKQFVEENGLPFKIGRGFYELTKRVLVQHHKEVILCHKDSGDFFTGDQARHMVGLPIGANAKLSPVYLKDYQVFIQSTSVNRKLLKNTDFLYEVF